MAIAIGSDMTAAISRKNGSGAEDIGRFAQSLSCGRST